VLVAAFFIIERVIFCPKTGSGQTAKTRTRPTLAEICYTMVFHLLRCPLLATKQPLKSLYNR
jgi:hypothetical protein